METEQPMRIRCKANTTLNAAVRGDKVILVPADSSDKSQHWIQDYDNVGKLTDDQGRRAFALVNRATGQALKITEDGRDLKLDAYKGHERVKLSMLWSLGPKLPSGFSEIRFLGNLAKTFNVLGGCAMAGKPVGIFNSEPHYDHAIWEIVPIHKG